MSKIICVGDCHGTSWWKLIAEMEKPWDKLIMIGDYFDTHETISAEIQIRNFQEIAKFKEEYSDRVVLLLGNHDGYIDDCFNQVSVSGYQSGAAPTIKHLLNTYRDQFKMAHNEGNILFTHAGVGETWLKECHLDVKEDYPFNDAKDIADKVNDVWLYRPFNFAFRGWRDMTGDEIGQGPTWIRPRALLQDTKLMRRNNIIQIVGHTRVHKIDIEGSRKNTGGKLFMIDALGTSGEYLVIQDGEFSVKTIK